MKSAIQLFGSLFLLVQLVFCVPGNLRIDVYLYLCNNLFVDYYWRDFNGTIPWDAIEGGKDSSGEKTYIGQALYSTWLCQGALVTVNLQRGRKNAAIPIYGVQNTDKNIKVTLEYKSNTNKIRNMLTFNLNSAIS